MAVATVLRYMDDVFRGLKAAERPVAKILDEVTSTCGTVLDDAIENGELIDLFKNEGDLSDFIKSKGIKLSRQARKLLDTPRMQIELQSAAFRKEFQELVRAKSGAVDIDALARKYPRIKPEELEKFRKTANRIDQFVASRTVQDAAKPLVDELATDPDVVANLARIQAADATKRTLLKTTDPDELNLWCKNQAMGDTMEARLRAQGLPVPTNADLRTQAKALSTADGGRYADGYYYEAARLEELQKVYGPHRAAEIAAHNAPIEAAATRIAERAARPIPVDPRVSKYQDILAKSSKTPPTPLTKEESRFKDAYEKNFVRVDPQTGQGVYKSERKLGNAFSALMRSEGFALPNLTNRMSLLNSWVFLRLMGDKKVGAINFMRMIDLRPWKLLNPINMRGIPVDATKNLRRIVEGVDTVLAKNGITDKIIGLRNDIAALSPGDTAGIQRLVGEFAAANATELKALKQDMGAMRIHVSNMATHDEVKVLAALRQGVSKAQKANSLDYINYMERMVDDLEHARFGNTLPPLENLNSAEAMENFLSAPYHHAYYARARLAGAYPDGSKIQTEVKDALVRQLDMGIFAGNRPNGNGLIKFTASRNIESLIDVNALADIQDFLKPVSPKVWDEPYSRDLASQVLNAYRDGFGHEGLYKVLQLRQALEGSSTKIYNGSWIEHLEKSLDKASAADMAFLDHARAIGATASRDGGGKPPILGIFGNWKASAGTRGHQELYRKHAFYPMIAQRYKGTAMISNPGVGFAQKWLGEQVSNVLKYTGGAQRYTDADGTIKYAWNLAEAGKDGKPAHAMGLLAKIPLVNKVWNTDNRFLGPLVRTPVRIAMLPLMPLRKAYSIFSNPIKATALTGGALIVGSETLEAAAGDTLPGDVDPGHFITSQMIDKVDPFLNATAGLADLYKDGAVALSSNLGLNLYNTAFANFDISDHTEGLNNWLHDKNDHWLSDTGWRHLGRNHTFGFDWRQNFDAPEEWARLQAIYTTDNIDALLKYVPPALKEQYISLGGRLEDIKAKFEELNTTFNNRKTAFDKAQEDYDTAQKDQKLGTASEEDVMRARDTFNDAREVFTDAEIALNDFGGTLNYLSGTAEQILEVAPQYIRNLERLNRGEEALSRSTKKALEDQNTGYAERLLYYYKTNQSALRSLVGRPAAGTQPAANAGNNLPTVRLPNGTVLNPNTPAAPASSSQQSGNGSSRPTTAAYQFTSAAATTTPPAGQNQTNRPAQPRANAGDDNSALSQFTAATSGATPYLKGLTSSLGGFFKDAAGFLKDRPVLTGLASAIMGLVATRLIPSNNKLLNFGGFLTVALGSFFGIHALNNKGSAPQLADAGNTSSRNSGSIHAPRATRGAFSTYESGRRHASLDVQAHSALAESREFYAATTSGKGSHAPLALRGNEHRANESRVVVETTNDFIRPTTPTTPTETLALAA